MEEALESEAETRMRYRAESAQVEVPRIIRHVHIALVACGKQFVVIFFHESLVGGCAAYRRLWDASAQVDEWALADGGLT